MALINLKQRYNLNKKKYVMTFGEQCYRQK